MTKGNTLMALLGIIMLSYGLLSFPFAIMLAIGGTLLATFIPSNITQWIAGFGIFAVIIDALLVYFGFKLVNTNQTQFSRFLLGILGIASIITAIAIIAAGWATAIAEIIAIGLFIAGLGLVDMGFGTKIAKPVSNRMLMIK